MRTKRHVFLWSAIAVLAIAGLTACSRVAEPPSKEDLNRLAAEDSTKYVGKDQCLSQFQWPVMTTVEADGTPTWYVFHDELNSLVAAGLVNRSVRQERVEVDNGQAVSQPRLLFELTPKATPLVQTHDDVDADGKKATLLCFGKLAWDGNASLEPVRVSKDSVEGFIFHSSEYDEYPAYREPENDEVVSRLSYTLHVSLSDYSKAHETELANFIDDAFRTRKVYVDVVKIPKGMTVPNAGKGWVVDQSTPGKGD